MRIAAMFVIMMLGLPAASQAGACPPGECYSCRPHPKLGEICACRPCQRRGRQGEAMQTLLATAGEASGPRHSQPDPILIDTGVESDAPYLCGNALDNIGERDFARLLWGAGIKEHALNLSILNGFFQEPLWEAHQYLTSHGTADVAFFKCPREAAAIRIRALDAPQGRYRYAITGRFTRQIVDSARPLYFILNRNLFIQTDNQGLNEAIQQALEHSP